MSSIALLGLGIGFIVAEIFFGSFFLLFIGIGLCITAGIEYIVGFGSGSVESVYMWQALSICAFSFLSLILLRKPIKSWLKGSQVYEDSFQNGGVGEIRQGMVYFKGTFWAYELDLASEKSTESSKADSCLALDSGVLNDGDKVEVLAIRKGKVVISLPNS